VGDKRRNLWPVLLAAAIVVAVMWVLYAVGRAPEQRRNDLATYWGFALALVVPAAGWIVWVWRRRKKQDGGTSGFPDLDHLADHLAEAVNKQWEETARERRLLWPEAIQVRWRKPSGALAGPVGAAVGSTRFVPLPGLRPVKEQDLREGDITGLHAVYGGLGSGRLVIAGAPGSGKSGAAVLLILAALRYREQVVEAERSKVPVPVLFTLHGWDPSNRSIEEWLAARLQRTYPLFTGEGGARKAAGLLASNKVAVILDGLDEIAEELRPAALRALSAQARFRVILICRTEEMTAAVQEGMFDGAVAVELQPVGPHDAARYLTDVQRDPPPAGWAELTRRLDEAPDSALAQALCSPLALTLVRDTYRSGDDVHELIDISNDAGSGASRERIEVHLLDRVLPAAYGRIEGRPKPRYDLEQAENVFQYIASNMSQNNTADLRWWLISDWSAYDTRVIMTGIATGLVTVLWVTSAVILIGGKPRGGLLLGAIGGIAAAIYFGKNAEDNMEFAAGPPPGILPFNGGGIRGLARWFGDTSNVKANPLTPKASWRSAFMRAAALTPLLAFFCGFAAGGFVSLAFDNPFTVSALETEVFVGLAVAFAAIPACVLTATPTWPASLTFVQLRFSQHTPLRLMRFFEDARERGVLRTVGPVYQFRHARLQDRLAEQGSPSVSTSDPSEVTAV
jgi:hypothetical protein